MSDQPATIVVIEDDIRVQRFLGATLESHGYRHVDAVTALAGIDCVSKEEPAAVLLDLQLPDMDGILVISELRRWTRVPIIVISSRSTEESKVQALDLGATDYITKPFSVAEMHARLRAALRDHRLPSEEESFYADAGLEVDLANRTVRLDGKPVKLSRREFDLLRLFVIHAGALLVHARILTEIWGPDLGGEVGYLRVFVNRLRKKIERNPQKPERLITELGLGYRWRKLRQTAG
jgi:two-component system KDP operon response regulator KdpE